MPTNEELNFADQVGRHFSRYYSAAPMAGRVAGWLLICDPPGQTVAEIAEALQASRSAVGTAVDSLELWSLVRRSRAPGERADRVSVLASFGSQSLESPAEYGALSALARQGLEVMGEGPPGPRARLTELGAFADFLLERMPSVAAEWQARLDELRASGELPNDS